MGQRSAAATPTERRLALAVILAPWLGFVVAVVHYWRHGIGPVELALVLGGYAVTLLGIEAGFHRCFSHRAFKAGSGLTVGLLVAGSMAAQGPALFWATIHRKHHQRSDAEGDPHSPHLSGPGWRGALKGLWHAHTGWMLNHHLGMDEAVKYAPDLLSDPLISRLGGGRMYLLWVALGLALPGAVSGMASRTYEGLLLGALWGGLARIFLVQHLTWSVNSICHLYGGQPFDTGDQSRNNALLVLPSFGGAWHNNHHAFPQTFSNRFHWWQIDLCAVFISLLHWLGFVAEPRFPIKAQVLERRRSTGIG